MRTRPVRLLIAIFGIGFLVAGPFAIVQGLSAKNRVKEALVQEHITTAKDSKLPGRLVKDAATAQAQADVIRKHTLEATGGKSYAQLDRNDPDRALAFQGSALRTSLMTSVLAFGVGDLVIGFGAFVSAVGLAFVLVAVLDRQKVETAKPERLLIAA